MKALTIWQPWASLIIAGVKPYEFRGWCPPQSIHGRKIAIHAGARPVKKGEIAELIVRLKSAEAWSTCLKMPLALELLEGWHSSPGRLPLASVIGFATLGKPLNAMKIIGEFGGVVNDSDRNEHANWAWPLTDIVAMEMVPARGAQGFWDWNENETTG